MSLTAITAAPVPLVLGQKEYQLSPLQRKDWGILVAWVQDEILELCERQIAKVESLDLAEKEALRKDAQRRASCLSEMSPEVLSRVASLRGLLKCLWLGLRKEHPDLSEDDVYNLLLVPGENEPDPEILDYMLERFESVNKRRSGVVLSKKVKAKGWIRRVLRILAIQILKRL